MIPSNTKRSTQQHAARSCSQRAQARIAGLALGALICTLAACDTFEYYDSGATQYLAPYGGAAYSPTADVDNVSFWDGDGIAGSPKIVIDLSDQRAYFYRGGQLVGVSLVSTGREGYETRPGAFKITQKSANHRSNLYGDYVDAAGNVVVKDVSVKKDPKPAGTRFRGASMPFFMRFDGGIGMHAGFLPGFPASHGCVRMPDFIARKYFANVSQGTPVIVRL